MNDINIKENIEIEKINNKLIKNVNGLINSNINSKLLWTRYIEQMYNIFR